MVGYFLEDDVGRPRFFTGRHNTIKLLLLTVVLSFSVALFPVPPCYSRDDDIRTLEVEGTGRVINDDFARGRNEAIRDALRRAVKEATTVWLPAGLPAQKALAVKEALNARAEGYIQDFRIIAENPHKTVYSVVVRVTVSADNIRKDLLALGFIKDQQQGYPTVLVRLTIRGLANYADYVKIKELLRFGLGGVKSMSERQIEWKTVRVDLQIVGTAKLLAAELASNSPLPLDVRMVDRDSIEIAVLN